MYIKYRAKTLNDFVGNESLVKSLKFSYIDNPAMPNTPVMFTGNFGSGKTTLAYILANHFCSNVSENVFEINCGDKRKIDDSRALIKTIKTTSIFGVNKAIILDEVHRLNEHSQSAWLTELEEELPDNVIIIACTTTTEKMLPALLRRFTQYKVNVLSVPDCKTLINRVCKAEDTKLPMWLKVLLIEKSNYVPGVILSNLPKIINTTDEAEAEELLDIFSVDASKGTLNIFKMILAKNKWDVIKQDVDKLLKNEDPDLVRIGLINIISVRMLSNYMKGNAEGRNLVRSIICLKNAYAIPYKASLISALYEISLIFSDEHYW